MDRQLTFKQRILAAATLFGMFFGPASLIFPVHLGQLAGSNVIPAAIGFLITLNMHKRNCVLGHSSF